MRYRPLGRTGQFVSEICLGAMTFHGGAGLLAHHRHARSGGLDRARRPRARSRASISSTRPTSIPKGSPRFSSARPCATSASSARTSSSRPRCAAAWGRGRTPSACRAAISWIRSPASLKRLGLDHIDLYQIHGFDPVTPLEETLRALDDCVSRGLVRTIGCSNLAAWQIMKALGISDKRGYARFETVQAYYSIAGRDLEREIVPLVEDQGLGVMVWSPLAGGFLSGKFTRDKRGDNDSRRTAFDFPPVDKERAYDIIDAMAPIAKAHGVSVARVALAWLLQRKGVMSVIIGAKTIEQLDDNLAAAELDAHARRDRRRSMRSARSSPNIRAGCWRGQAEGRVPAAKA